MFVVWYLVLAATLAAFIVLHAFVMPRLFFRINYDIKTPTGRGVKIADGPRGRTIVYDGDFAVRKYMPQYMIIRENGKKRLVCRVNDRLSYVDYDVVVFDGYNRVKDMLHVKEVLTVQGRTAAVELPSDTAYVSVCLNAADGREFKNSRARYRVTGLCWAAFLLACAVVEIITVQIVRICLARLYGGLFADIFLYSLESNIIAGVITALAVALNAVLMLVVVRRRNRARGGGA